MKASHVLTREAGPPPPCWAAVSIWASLGQLERTDDIYTTQCVEWEVKAGGPESRSVLGLVSLRPTPEKGLFDSPKG